MDLFACMQIDESPNDAGMLDLMWERTSLSKHFIGIGVRATGR